MTSINPNNNSNEIRQYAETIFAKLDAKDGKDDSISKSIWEQFIGGKVEEQEIGNGSKSQIKVRITKENAINSIVSYIKKFGLDKKEAIDNVVDNIEFSQTQNTSKKQGSSSKIPKSPLHEYLEKESLRREAIKNTMEARHPEIVNDIKEYRNARGVLSKLHDAFMMAFINPNTKTTELDFSTLEGCEMFREHLITCIGQFEREGYSYYAKAYKEYLDSFNTAIETAYSIEEKYANDEEPSFQQYLNSVGGSFNSFATERKLRDAAHQ